MIHWVLTVAILSLAVGATGSGQLHHAWWLTATFDPKDLTVEAFPVRELDLTWVAASALKTAVLPAEAFARGESVQEHGGAFEVSRDFDRDGRIDKAVVGVYRTDSGELGRFLLILTADKRGRWSKRAVFKQPGQAGFSVLFQERGRLVWQFCMECDSSCQVAPGRTTWTLKCQSCC